MVAFTDSKGELSGYAAGWFFWVHKAFREALDISYRYPIDEEKTKIARDKRSLALHGVTHDELKRQLGKNFADSLKHQEVMRTKIPRRVDTIGDPPAYNFRPYDGLESRCGRWYVQVKDPRTVGAESNEDEDPNTLYVQLFARLEPTQRWEPRQLYKLSQAEFGQLLFTGSCASLNLTLPTDLDAA
ncbi:hypothetical protein [Bordetella sp. 2513F-2]